MSNKKIIILTLVHPDFLPPVYAVAQVLRDLEFDVHILTFDSTFAEQFDIGPNIQIETMGKHNGAGTLQRLKLRNKFKRRAKQIVGEGAAGIITFCPFSFMCGVKVKKDIPLVYIALENSDFILSSFLNSPLSNFINLRSLNNIRKADVLATPSAQRSAWLAGRCHLHLMPKTIMNTAYLSNKEIDKKYDSFKELVPPDFLNKKIILYTGAVNADQCTLEMVRAFDNVNDEQSVFIIAGLKDDKYCNDLRELVKGSRSEKRILLFAYLPRNKTLVLQANAHIGVCLIREYDAMTEMMASNKIGEYMYNSLYVIGTQTEYLKPFQIRGIASLAATPAPDDVSIAIKEALSTIERTDYKTKIKTFVKNEFCMQKQLTPIIKYLNK